MYCKQALIINLLLTCFFGEIVFAAPLPTYNEKTTTINQNAREPAFVIELKSNRTTGYSWTLEAYDPTDIELLAHQYVPPKEMIAGAAGTERWTFQLTKKGLSSSNPLSLTFLYKRPWEAGKNGRTQTFVVSQ
jgi:predicted secreted protein